MEKGKYASPSAPTWCTAAKGEAAAAQLAQAVSEKQLQTVRVQGCGLTGRDDRKLRKLPDLRALGYPRLAKEETVLHAGAANDMSLGRESVHAQDFLPPYAPSPPPSASSTSPTAQLLQHSGRRLDLDVAASIATAIRGASAPVAPEVGDPAALGPMEPSYGDARSSPPPRPAPGTSAQLVARRCRAECRRFLYDLMHWDDISLDDLLATGCATKLQYLLSRDGRAPFLALTALLIALAVVSSALLLRSGL